MTPKLVIFDVDGTLVDSQAHILAAMARAFESRGLPVPGRARTLAIVGLSLPVAMARLAPDASVPEIDALVEAYRTAFAVTRDTAGAAPSMPLYPGARDALERLGARDDVLLGVATGKSGRGLAHVLAEHGLADVFVTRQTADGHPSKPNPSMVLAAMAETGAVPSRTVMIGDTTFDVDMAGAAGVAAIGVAWGYHAAPDLAAAGAATVLPSFDALDAALDTLWTRAA